MTDELYAVGWRTPGRPRQWVVAVYPPVPAAAAAAGGYIRFDGGGRWRVYTTRVVSAGRTTRVVHDRLVAAGLEDGSRVRQGRLVTRRR